MQYIKTTYYNLCRVLMIWAMLLTAGITHPVFSSPLQTSDQQASPAIKKAVTHAILILQDLSHRHTSNQNHSPDSNCFATELSELENIDLKLLMNSHHSCESPVRISSQSQATIPTFVALETDPMLAHLKTVVILN